LADVEQQLLEPIPTHIVKSYYTLRHLKMREKKIKLLHVLNYFRAIQRRITLDMKEMGTRDRVMGDLDVMPPQSGVN
jgi:hypothetical protein